MSVLRAIIDALGDEFAAWHLRLQALFEESDPRTTDELLAEWEVVYGLPLCDDIPPTDDARRAALAARVAAQGGQSRAYYIGLVRLVLGDPAAVVTIVERPYGTVFRTNESATGDLLSSPGVMHYWRVILPSGTDPALVAIIECLLETFKPAHTVLELIATLSAYYSTPGGAGSYLEASTPLAARLIFPGPADMPAWTIVYWVKQPTTDGLAVLTVGDIGTDGLATIAIDQAEQDWEIYDAGTPVATGYVGTAGGTDWRQHVYVHVEGDLSTYGDGVLSDTQVVVPASYSAQDVLRLLFETAEPGSIRNIAIFARDLNVDEIGELAAAGYRHDVRAPSGQGIEWVGETPSIYWCQSAIAGVADVSFWHLDGTAADATATADDGEIAANAFGFGRSVIFWMRVTQADEGGTVLRMLSTLDEVIQFMDLSLAAGGDFVLTLTANNGLIEGVSPASDGLPYDSFDFYVMDLAVDGIGRLYRNNVLICETAGIAPDPGAGLPDPYLWFRGENLNIVDITNVMIVDRLTTSDERASLTAAGPGHDYTVETGDWAGEDAAVRWPNGELPNAGTGGATTIDLDGVGAETQTEELLGGVRRVPNSGSAGVCDLNLYGDTTSEED